MTTTGIDRDEVAAKLERAIQLADALQSYRPGHDGKIDQCQPTAPALGSMLLDLLVDVRDGWTFDAEVDKRETARIVAETVTQIQDEHRGAAARVNLPLAFEELERNITRAWGVVEALGIAAGVDDGESIASPFDQTLWGVADTLHDILEQTRRLDCAVNGKAAAAA